MAGCPRRGRSRAGGGGGASRRWEGLVYYRLHGSPVIYRSSYEDARLEAYADALRGEAAPAWCIFDNTASSAAAANALALMEKVSA